MAHGGSEVGGHPRRCVPWLLMAVTTALWRCAKGKPCLGVAHQKKKKSPKEVTPCFCCMHHTGHQGWSGSSWCLQPLLHHCGSQDRSVTGGTVHSSVSETGRNELHWGFPPFPSMFSFFLWFRVSSIKLAIVPITGVGFQGAILKSVWD